MTSCPVCNDPGTTEQGLLHGEYHLRHCPVCGLMFWHPMRARGPEAYDAWPLDFAEVRPVWSVQSAHAKFLRDMPARGGRLLDVGCGIGDFCYLAQKAGYATTGIDFSHRFIEVARQRFPDLDLEEMTLAKFVAKRAGEKYDIVTFIQVLEHLDNVRHFLEMVTSVLRPGGYVVCAVPNRSRWRLFPQVLREDWDYPPNHFTWWDADSLASLFARHGLTVLSIEVDPVRPFDCAFLLTEKLGLVKLAAWVGRRLRRDGGSHGSSVDSVSGVGSRAATLGYRLYHRVFVPLCGLATLPLLPFLRKGGESIYLLAQANSEPSP